MIGSHFVSDQHVANLTGALVKQNYSLHGMLALRLQVASDR